MIEGDFSPSSAGGLVAIAQEYNYHYDSIFR